MADFVDSWLDSRLEIRDSALRGRGTSARAPIAAGEILTVWAHRVLTAPELAAAPSGSLSARGEGRLLWQPFDDHHAPDYLLNHSCDSHLGMADEVTLVARRAIRATEEVTIDYCLFTLDREWIAPFTCVCGAATCRGTLTGRDWERPELQARYACLFHPSIASRIAERAGSPDAPPPIAPDSPAA